MVQTRVSQLSRPTCRQNQRAQLKGTKYYCPCGKNQGEKSKFNTQLNAPTLNQNEKQKNNELISQNLDPDDSKLAGKSIGISDRKKQTQIENDRVEESKIESKENTGDYRQDLKMRKLEEYKAKKKREEQEREQFVKDMAVKRAAERAEVVKQARRLLLYRKPLCRGINRGLLVSECLRELDEQVVMQETIRKIEEEQDKKIDNAIKADVEKFNEVEKQREEEKIVKRRQYGTELKKQIDENELAAKAREKEEFESEKQDQINMSNYSQLQKEHEAEEILKKKKKLQQFFKDAIEEKKQFEMKLKQDEEYEDRAIEIYRKSKARVQKMQKEMRVRERQECERRAQRIIEKCGGGNEGSANARRAKEDELLKKAIEEQEAAEKKKQEARKERENARLASIRQFQLEDSAIKEKQNQENKDFRNWEMLQRLNRDEHDKQTELEERNRELKKRMDYANILKSELEEKEARMNQEKMLEDKAENMQHVIEKENKKVLDYAEEVLAESKGVRPLYPILKAIQGCKNEMGLAPEKKPERVLPPKKTKRRRGIKKPCNQVLPEEKLFYF